MAERKTWCPKCGPDVEVYNDGDCRHCHSRAVGKGADQAHMLKEIVDRRIQEDNRKRARDEKDRQDYDGEDGGSPFY